MSGFEKRLTNEHIAEERAFEPQAHAARHARYGMVLFAVYLLFYAAFVLMNAFRPEWMDRVPAAGVNLAIWYGFALIAIALALALFYVWLCRGAKVGRASCLPGTSEACPTKPEGRP